MSQRGLWANGGNLEKLAIMKAMKREVWANHPIWFQLVYLVFSCIDKKVDHHEQY